MRSHDERSLAGSGLAAALVALAMAVWAGQTPAAGITVADSVAEFSDVQGQDGWYYGQYATPGDSATFEQFLHYDVYGDWWEYFTGQPPWRMLWDDGGIADATWTVRRWVSDVSGTVSITGELADVNNNGFGGDGVIARILLNGAEVFSQYLYWAPGDPGPTPLAYTLTGVSVDVGDVIDFAIDPIGSAYYDDTRFTATIELAAAAPPPGTGTVPAPGALALWAAGLLALGAAAGRRRR